jgi:hypothetical protein
MDLSNGSWPLLHAVDTDGFTAVPPQSPGSAPGGLPPLSVPVGGFPGSGVPFDPAQAGGGPLPYFFVPLAEMGPEMRDALMWQDVASKFDYW